MNPAPLVTVLVTTYNQEKYISSALDSILAQQVSFPYEILVSEDHGKDGTRAILEQYAARHPNIRLYLREENVGISRNWYEGLQAARGDFVCTLEGDDWWCSPHKLQRQVDFLQSHPDYVAVSHCIRMQDDAGNTYGTAPSDPRIVGKDATVPLFLRSVTFSLTACLCRNIFRDAPPAQKAYVTANRSIADFALCMLLLDAGRVFVLPDVLSVYRVAGQEAGHQNYNGSHSAVQKYQDYLDVILASRAYWGNRYSFTLCCMAGTFFPFCDRIKYGGLPGFLKAMRRMPVACRLLFPFYFVGRCTSLLAARLHKSLGRRLCHQIS